MKSIVVYFSQTGNTEKTARAIQTGVKQITGHCDIVKIKEANPRRLYEYDLIGLGFPIFHFREPGNVRAFVNNMRFLGGKHIFCFCTHCSQLSGYFDELLPKVKAKGLTIIGWNDWYGHSWGPSIQPTPYPTDGHPDEIDLEEAEDFGREMVRRSQRIYAGDTQLIPALPSSTALPEELESRSGAAGMVFQFKDFVKYDRGKCSHPKCRLCMDNCPMDGIDLTVEPPIIARPCEDCFFCEAICPTGAIEVDEDFKERMAQAISSGLREFATEQLAEAKAQGRFRQLISDEKIGWDTPVYKVHSKRPRWIIGKGPT